MCRNLSIVALGLLLASSAYAGETQNLSATVAGKAFASDDDSILLVPVEGSFTLIASTAGASSYPPPTTPIDELSIRCKIASPAVPVKLDSKAFEDPLCAVTFRVGTPKPMGGDPEATYELDTSNPANHFTIAAVRGKVLEGSFQFRLKDKAGKTIAVESGKFSAEDRQL